MPDIKNPEKIIVIEVKVKLTFNGIKQLLNYLRMVIKKWKEAIKEYKGVMVSDLLPL